ncbi:MAG TPA: imidazolonepropionase [Ignavibacteria bacterium]|nr:imidazolonepropionase [Ignavibacteria bacterium]
MRILSNPSQIVTVNTNRKNYKRGSELSYLDVLTDHSVVIENGLIQDIIPNTAIQKINRKEIINLKGKIILPGLIDSHTHAAFAGSRSGEFRLRLRGVNYEQLAKKGGGISTTVNAVRASSFHDLLNLAKPRVDYFISQGITTLEIKSGYGLDFDNEMKLLKVISNLDKIYPIDIIPTFLGAHIFPKEFRNNHPGYIDLIINRLLPYVSENKLALFCDGFCESTAFSAEEINVIFKTAKKNGLKIKLHTEQFNNIGGIDVALNNNAVSVDHLEVIKNSDIQKLKYHDTVCTLLPGVSFFLNHKYAPARALIDSDAIVALATDFNPGSSNISNLHFIMSLAALKMNMNIEETISSVTINAAKALCMNESIGSIEIGKKADFAVFNTEEYSDIVYNIGNNLNYMTIKNGEIIYKQAS